MAYEAVAPHMWRVLWACRDGGLEATMDHEAGVMMCQKAGDVYTTQEPAAAFHGRTVFCLDIHNEVRSCHAAVACMRAIHCE